MTERRRQRGEEEREEGGRLVGLSRTRGREGARKRTEEGGREGGREVGGRERGGVSEREGGRAEKQSKYRGAGEEKEEKGTRCSRVSVFQ